MHYITDHRGRIHNILGHSSRTFMSLISRQEPVLDPGADSSGSKEDRN